MPHGEFGEPPKGSSLWTNVKRDLAFCELQNA
jgi:hypothetical protein